MGVNSVAAWVLVALCTIGCGDQTGDSLTDAGVAIVIGKAFVDQRGCPKCHQSSHPTDGTLSGQTTPQPGTMAYPANLTPDHSTGIGDWADVEIIRAMRYGFDNQGLPLCTPMPHSDGSDPAQPFMTDVEANAIVAYLRSLPAVKRRIPASMCPPIKPQPPVDMAAPAPVDLATSD